MAISDDKLINIYNHIAGKAKYVKSKLYKEGIMEAAEIVKAYLSEDGLAQLAAQEAVK